MKIIIERCEWCKHFETECVCEVRAHERPEAEAEIWLKFQEEQARKLEFPY